MSKYEAEYKGKSALEIVDAISEANDAWLKDEENRNEHQVDAANRIHWLCEELECRLGGHGGYVYATGPLLREDGSPQLVEKERLHREIHRHVNEKEQLRTKLNMIKTIVLRKVD